MYLKYGVGLNNNTRPSRIFGKVVKHYKLWDRMLNRCYSESFKKDHPSYQDCIVSDNFKNYSYFFDWCEDQTGFNIDNFELDKDLIRKGNKVYSEDTCLFLPMEINKVLINKKRDRGAYPVGVDFNKKRGKYRARYSKCGVSIQIGIFYNPHDAFCAYKKEKEKEIKLLAEKYKHKIDNRAYNALIAYEVLITD